MQNKKVTIAIVLCIGAVISLIYGIASGPKRRRTVAPVSEVRSTDKISPTARRIIPIERRAAKTDFVSWDRNPFSPAPLKPSGELTLNGISWDKDHPVAIINGAIRGIGDKVGGKRIVDIKEDRVILTDGTHDSELRLSP